MILQWCKAPDVGLPAPDIVFYMRVSPEAAARRGGYGEERYEKAEFQRTVSANFDKLQGGNWVVIDADQPIEQIHQQVGGGGGGKNKWTPAWQWRSLPLSLLVAWEVIPMAWAMGPRCSQPTRAATPFPKISLMLPA